ncbi:putative RnfABCDGE type electron transport complex subunit D [Magnetofaba australis IT-1]|uniref:Ion-translocating oxidoreductase complex subunit D n=1 Tax=Magnetofaba australis IT-1 TaxID=1434232 RepID=A0A1Y2K4A6_9PROT|nr:putative RnfABCDGE type electron transport complex subunit D [Magnetofaba australis IT-1]
MHGGDSIPKVMHTVIAALMPATLLSVGLFGFPALLVIVITTAACMVTEFIANALRGRPSTLHDGSAALTGILLALTLPPHSPWWICVVGGVFAIGVGKQVYGGLGYNMFNPALIARVFLLISFPVELTTWPEVSPIIGDNAFSFMQSLSIIFSGDYGSAAMDTITAATPLGHYKTEMGLGRTVHEALMTTFGFDYINAASGEMGGSLGETSAILLLGGGLYMIHKKLIGWHIPAAMLAGCLLPAAIMWLVNGDKYPDPLFHLLTGGLILGAFFMATDMVTSPVTPRGQIIFGAGCGFLTYVIRTWTGYPEGVSFAVVIMNCAVPLIDQYTRPVVYGKSKRAKENA